MPVSVPRKARTSANVIDPSGSCGAVVVPDAVAVVVVVVVVDGEVITSIDVESASAGAQAALSAAQKVRNKGRRTVSAVLMV